jgi:nicotinamide-nucleotide amidase
VRGAGVLYSLLLVITGVNTSPALKASDAQPARQAIPYALIITGSELLSGAYADGHTHYITRTLAPLGLQCLASMCVPDESADIQPALDFASLRANLIIMTGGLGPTDNDRTRAVLTEFTGIGLKEDVGVLQDMARRFHVTPKDLRPNLRRQTQVPIQGTYFKNKNGTAVGLVFEKTDQVIIALPGPPRELQPMLQDALLPYLKRRYGTRSPGCSLILRFVGLGQSQIDQVLSDRIQIPAGITLSSQFQGARVDFTFSIPSDTAQDHALLGNLKKAVMQHLGAHVYADSHQTLEECVVQQLKAQGITLALVEVGSGAGLTAALMQTSEASDVLAGSYVAPTLEKLGALLGLQPDHWKGLSPEKSTEHLAQAAARSTGSLWTLVTGPPQSGRGASPRVDVAFRRASGEVKHQSLRVSGVGGLAHAKLTTQLLDQLRRQLQLSPAINSPRSNVSH